MTTTAPDPCRVQRSRKKGARLPEGARCVTKETPFGNPFPWEEVGRAAAVEAFSRWIEQPEQAALREQARRELRGLPLACYCPLDGPCHADVLLEIANAPSEESAQ